MTSSYESEHAKYRQLLVVLVSLFLIAPFLESSTIGSMLNGLLLLSTLITVVQSLKLPRKTVGIHTAIACMAYGLDMSATMGWISASVALGLITQSLYALYLGGAAYWIGRDIFSSYQVTSDTVRGGICIYLLIGFLWALLYGIAEVIDSNAFSQQLVLDSTSFLKAIHFSFTTLTTLGYGDIVPVSELALVLTNLEAIVGQMYSTIFIAILVGSYLFRQRQDFDQT